MARTLERMYLSVKAMGLLIISCCSSGPIFSETAAGRRNVAVTHFLTHRPERRRFNFHALCFRSHSLNQHKITYGDVAIRMICISWMDTVSFLRYLSIKSFFANGVRERAQITKLKDSPVNGNLFRQKKMRTHFGIISE